MSFSSIAILSPGLLGGSLALAVRERMKGAELRVWARREETVQKAKAMGMADVASTDAGEIAAKAELIVFCMPMGGMAEVAERLAPVVRPNAVATDVGSVKEPVVRQLGEIFRGRAEFIGSHPMAGSEQAGIGSARADLFQDAMTIITPEAGASQETVKRLRDFWKLVGCRVAIATPRAHDEAVGLISHLPHLAAAALVQAAMQENPAALEWRGNGFLDTTRVASGPAGMWAEILMENKEALKRAVRAMVENLTEVTTMLDAGDAKGVELYLAEAKERRDRMKRGG
jgi:prephenate dehydrogenase